MRVNAVVGAACGADGSAKVEGDAEWHDPHPQSNGWCETTAAETVACCVVPAGDAALIPPTSEPHVMTDDSAPSAASSSGSKPLQPRHQRVMTAVIARTARTRLEGRPIWSKCTRRFVPQQAASRPAVWRVYMQSPE